MAFYWAFVALTGPFYLLIYLSFLKANNRPIPGSKQWPWWRCVASVIAFGAWALAIPGNPLIKGDASGAVAGFAALFVSTILTRIEPFFDNA
jgi:hypothetical protein